LLGLVEGALALEDASQVVMRRREIGLDGHRLADQVDGLSRPAGCVGYQAQEVERIGLSRRRGQDLPVMGLGFSQVPLAMKLCAAEQQLGDLRVGHGVP
jgi:hypothetical protein